MAGGLWNFYFFHFYSIFFFSLNKVNYKELSLQPFNLIERNVFRKAILAIV